jgi:Flp pilus assembly protein TadG
MMKSTWKHVKIGRSTHCMTRRMQTETGTSLLEVALITPILALLLLGVVDFGRAFYLGIEVSNAARAGAQYGYQTAANMQDVAGIEAAATKDATDAPTMTFAPVPSWGCMCSDGSQVTPTCGTTLTCNVNNRQINYVRVDTQLVYTPIFQWPGLPASFPLKGKSVLWAGQ